MEDQDDVEGDEFRSGDREGEADEDGVENDAEFEDANGCHLRGVVFYFVRGLFVFMDGGFYGSGAALVVVIVVDVVSGVGEVVFARGVTLAG